MKNANRYYTHKQQFTSSSNFIQRMHPTIRIILYQILYHPIAQLCRKVKPIIQHYGRNMRIMPHNRKLRLSPHRPREVIRVASFQIPLPMNRALRPCSPVAEKLKRVELAAARRPAGTRDVVAVVAVLQDAWDGGVEEPVGGRVGEKALVGVEVGVVVHLEFDEEGFVRAGPAV